MSRKWSVSLVAITLLVLALVVSACSTASTVANATTAPTKVATKAAAATTAATKAVTATTAATIAATKAATATTAPTKAATTISATVAITTGAKYGKILTDAKGMALYLYTADSAGKSTCTGSCLTTWPAFTVAKGVTPVAGTGVTGKLGTITRDDGTLQVTINSLPLYYYSKDLAAGDTNGQGLNSAWHLSDPAGTPIK
jgi:predicted lipoprotein with Yx(FWY)xxD motif